VRQIGALGGWEGWFDLGVFVVFYIFLYGFFVNLVSDSDETLFRIYLSESAADFVALPLAAAQALTVTRRREGTRFRESSALRESVGGHDTRRHDVIHWSQWIQ
jgi:hypothetical protein